jgi:hypothetical protein
MKKTRKKMDKIKSVISTGWGWLVLILGGVIAVLLYALNIRNKELDAQSEKIAMAKNQKEVDSLEADIKTKLADVGTDEKTRQGLQQSLDVLEKKRQDLNATDPRATDQEKADYWNKK